MFQRNITCPSSGGISEARNQHACCLLHTGFFLALFFDPEDGSNIFHQYTG
jgi:hypothetical protein